MTPTPTQVAICAIGLQYLQHLMTAPARLAPAPRDAIRRRLPAKGLILPAAIEHADENTAWTVNGLPTYHRLAKAGLCAAVGAAPPPARRGAQRRGERGVDSYNGRPRHSAGVDAINVVARLTLDQLPAFPGGLVQAASTRGAERRAPLRHQGC